MSPPAIVPSVPDLERRGVHGVDGHRRLAGEHLVGQHGPRPRPSLLGGLEHEHHRALEPIARGGERFRERQADGGVDVVPADVTDAGNLGAELDRIRRIGAHRIHVGAERDHRPGPRAAQHGHDPVPAHIGAHLEPHGKQTRRDLGGGAALVVGDFRVAVQVAPERDQVGVALGEYRSGDGKRRGLRSGHRQRCR
jgi:hypothetical protein